VFAGVVQRGVRVFGGVSVEPQGDGVGHVWTLLSQCQHHGVTAMYGVAYLWRYGFGPTGRRLARGAWDMQRFPVVRSSGACRLWWLESR
jgi:hypothetical protein